MKLLARYKPELVAAAHPGTKLTIQHVLLDDLAEPRLVATDGVALVVVPVETDSEDKAGLIPATALRAARKINPEAEHLFLRVNGKVEIPEALTLFDRPVGTFPLWREIVPKNHTARITLDINRLMSLAQALGATAKDGFITISFDQTDERSNAVLSITKRRNDPAVGYLAQSTEL